MKFKISCIGETRYYVKYETEDMFPQGKTVGKCEAKLWIPKAEFQGSGAELGMYPQELEIELSIPEPLGEMPEEIVVGERDIPIQMDLDDVPF